MDGSIYSCPSLLCSFHAIFFADLKRYRFTYHFAFPSIHSVPAWEVLNDASDASSRLSDTETPSLIDAVQTWKYSVDCRQHGFFLARRLRSSIKSTEPKAADVEQSTTAQTADDESPPNTEEQEPPYSRWTIGALSSFENGFFEPAAAEDCFICFADLSTYANIPNIILRNLLALVRHRWHLSEAQILCYRETHGQRDKVNSFVLQLKSLPEIEAINVESTPATIPQMPKVTGWERNDKGAINSKIVDLSGNMDPVQFADQSVDLNIKLMKWRIAPNLDLDVIKNTKCLLLGAGTLGSYVSRNLLGWGVRTITFVDNGRVSYSNPVRQPLFNFKDCDNGGVKKATRAAEALKEIYPGVTSTGYDMSVPMIGHPIIHEDKTKQEFDQLRQLVDEHDVIFLLMDTRESRWLPTVMARATGKLVMNAALGFDSYVVMRHGVQAQSSDAADAEMLGCYFCNDVVAPADVSCSSVCATYMTP